MGMLGICPFLPIGFILLRSFISYFSYAFKWVIVPTLLGFDMTTIVADPVSYPFPSVFLYTFFRCVSAAWSVLLAVGAVTVLTFKKEYFYDFAAAVGFLTALSQSTKVYDDNQASVFWLLVRGVPMWDFEPVKRAVGSVIDRLMTGTARSGGAGQGLVDWEAEGLGMDWKQGLVTILVMVWAVKFGAYTTIRTILRNGDSRFDEVRTDPKVFLALFMIQIVWIMACLGPVIALNMVPPEAFPYISPVQWELEYTVRMALFWFGLCVCVRGLCIETIADYQISKWRIARAFKKHKEVFCSWGLWSGCRHPNYYGECLFWLGLSIACLAVLISEVARSMLGLTWLGAVLLCVASPMFTFYLIRDLSIPVVEKKYDALYMHRKDYRRWRRTDTLRLWLDRDQEKPVECSGEPEEADE